MLSKIGTFVLNWLLGKLPSIAMGLYEKAKSWFKAKSKEKRRDKQVVKQETKVDEVRKEIDEYLEKNPEATKIPKELENKMRDAVRSRNDGLRG